MGNTECIDFLLLLWKKGLRAEPQIDRLICVKLKVVLVLILGIVSVCFLLLSKIEGLGAHASFAALFAGVIGSFWGIWTLISALFKTISLTSKEKLTLAIGILLSVLSFALSRYGTMVVWLPVTTIGIVGLKFNQYILGKVTTRATDLLQKKINSMEEQHQNEKPTSVPPPYLV